MDSDDRTMWMLERIEGVLERIANALEVLAIDRAAEWSLDGELPSGPSAPTRTNIEAIRARTRAIVGRNPHAPSGGPSAGGLQSGRDAATADASSRELAETGTNKKTSADHGSPSAPQPAPGGPIEEREPIVCPGCYSVDDEPCKPGCIDEEMRREREDDAGRGACDDVDDGPPPDDEPPPDDFDEIDPPAPTAAQQFLEETRRDIGPAPVPVLATSTPPALTHVVLRIPTDRWDELDALTRTTLQQYVRANGVGFDITFANGLATHPIPRNTAAIAAILGHGRSMGIEFEVDEVAAPDGPAPKLELEPPADLPPPNRKRKKKGEATP